MIDKSEEMYIFSSEFNYLINFFFFLEESRQNHT